MEVYYLLRCMVKAGEAENCYTARSGRPAAWLVQPSGPAAPYTFGNVMEVRALMGPKAREEEAKRLEETKVARRKRALTKEAVASGLREVIREAGMAEDIIRDESMEVVSGGGIRRMDLADLSISRAIKMDSLPAWAEHGRGRGRGNRGATNWSRGSGSRGSRGARGRGRGDAGRSRGRGGTGGRRGRGKPGDPEMTGGNSEAVPYRKRKNEDKTAEEAKRVKHTLEPPSASAASASSAAVASTSSSSASQEAPKKKSLLSRLLTEKVDAGKGYGLFD
jgi:hypothetical protein